MYPKRESIWFLALALAVAGAVSTMTGDQGRSLAATSEISQGVADAAAPVDPQRVVGNEACVKCHASEIQTWKQTPHATTFDQLHRRPEAKQIADKLGIRSIKHEGRCVACHYTTKVEGDAAPHAIAGVSCESCHGAAQPWLELHCDYGGSQITRATEAPAARAARIARSIAAGMRNPHNVYLLAQSCLRCHTVGDEELVNVGGHSVGSLDFELVSWSQGSIRHNFVRSDGKTNDVSSPERLRKLFVAGLIAELEAGLRATAKATTKATYGIAAAERTARAAARIQSVAAKIEAPELMEIVSLMETVSLKLNHGEALTAAADEVARWGYQFAASTTADLSPLDRFIPGPDRYK